MTPIGTRSLAPATRAKERAPIADRAIGPAPAPAESARKRRRVVSSSAFTLVVPRPGPRPGMEGARSISRLERRAEHLLPLLLLGVGEDGLELLGVVLAEALDLRSNLFRVAPRLRLLDQGLDARLQVVRDGHELLHLLRRDLQLFPDVLP